MGAPPVSTSTVNENQKDNVVADNSGINSSFQGSKQSDRVDQCE